MTRRRWCQRLLSDGDLLASNAMDEIDRAILAQLQEDGRLSNVELAERVGLSPSPCLRRVRALEAAGVITGYRAVLDPAKVDRAFQVLVHVTMAVGDRDYLLWIAVQDLQAYERLYMGKLVGLPGVARTTSQLTLKTVKPGGRLPLQPH